MPRDVVGHISPVLTVPPHSKEPIIGKHTSCISEAEKYEKGLYKGKNKQQQQPPKPSKQPPAKSTKPKSTIFNDVTGSQNLYKVLKKASKDDSKKLKEILKTLKITKVDGKIVIE